jgi:tRNA (guanine10-N2)-dimethyltransferase
MSKLKRYYVVFSGEHRTLPLAELRAITDSEGIYCKELVNLDMVSIVESTEELPIYISRSALIKFLGEVITIAESDADLVSTIRGVDWENMLGKGKLYTFDLIRIKEYSSWVDYKEMLNVFKSLGIGRFTYHTKTNKLANQEVTTIDLVLSNGLAIIGRRLYSRKHKILSSRDPKYRPIYKPGTMKAIMSRVLVNLSRVSSRRREVFLDPFCGVGGLLIEACFMGLKYYGSDIDVRCVEGATTNLNYFGCTSSVAVADACKLPFRYADGVGTDPPYGRLSRVSNYKSIYELMECSINCLSDIIRRGGYLAIAQSSDVDLNDILVNNGFKLVEKHYNWVHGSLVRNIYVAVRL